MLILVLIPFICTACFEGEEGCLDFAASNYSVSADSPCPNCCTYPVFQLSFRHKAVQGRDTLNLFYEDNFQDDFGQYFAFEDISYLLSSLHFIDFEASDVLIEEEIRVPVFEANGDSASQDFEDNFALINPSDFSTNTIGTLTFSGLVQALNLQIGVSDLINQTQPAYYEDTHPLSSVSSSLYQSEEARYAAIQLSFYRDTLRNLEELEVINITERDASFQVSLPINTQIPAGSNISLILEVDYLNWLSGVDIQKDSIEEVKTKIVGNIANSISIFSITFSS